MKLNTMFENILNFDTSLFRAINSCRSLYADWFFSIFSAHITIGIIIMLITLYVMYKHSFKHWYLYVIVIALCFLLADRISVICFKDVFCRLRPSHALSDAVTVKLKHYSYLVYDNKGGLYGFVSSHAANAFTIITSIILIMFRKVKQCNENDSAKEKKHLLIFSSLLILWGLLTGISRIYCGYHYPGDVFCGALLGIILGFIVYRIYLLLLSLIDSIQSDRLKHKKEKI
ncbi:MAG: phosphatase PAP2 family protein [Bacteroidales bacterium]|nr:phosphatase PAP2 family protein [Bacteroidales bacterium]